MSYLRLCFGRGCGHSEPASYEFRCAAGPSTPELRCCGQLLRNEYLMNTYTVFTRPTLSGYLTKISETRIVKLR